MADKNNLFSNFSKEHGINKKNQSEEIYKYFTEDSKNDEANPAFLPYDLPQPATFAVDQAEQNYQIFSNYQENSAPQVTHQDNFVPQGTHQNNFAPQATHQANFVPQGTLQDNFAPQGTLQNNFAAQATHQANFVPQGTLQDNFVPKACDHPERDFNRL